MDDVVSLWANVDSWIILCVVVEYLLTYVVGDVYDVNSSVTVCRMWCFTRDAAKSWRNMMIHVSYWRFDNYNGRCELWAMWWHMDGVVSPHGLSSWLTHGLYAVCAWFKSCEQCVDSSKGVVDSWSLPCFLDTWWMWWHMREVWRHRGSGRWCGIIYIVDVKSHGYWCGMLYKKYLAVQT